jgi:ribosomal protein L40E
MRCSSCNVENSADASFCEHCGSKLELVCPACKAKIGPSARFCKKCGAAVAGSESTAPAGSRLDATFRTNDISSENLEGERKTVTALFADIKGSTELEQDLDPEEARAMLAEIYNWFTEGFDTVDLNDAKAMLDELDA